MQIQNIILVLKNKSNLTRLDTLRRYAIRSLCITRMFKGNPATFSAQAPTNTHEAFAIISSFSFADSYDEFESKLLQDKCQFRCEFQYSHIKHTVEEFFNGAYGKSHSITTECDSCVPAIVGDSEVVQIFCPRERQYAIYEVMNSRFI